MACVILQDIEGNKRTIPENTPFVKQPGEKIVGVDHNCAQDKAQAPANPNTANALARELNHELGAGLGDFVKVLAKPIAWAIGKKNCSSCEARRVVLNAYGKLKAKHGMVEAVRIMKEIPTNNPEEALVALRQHLKD